MTLNVAFLWHMHQPLYLDPEEGLFRLPWVRLHATKDYLFVARLMEKYPELHHTVNFAPCLIEQILYYVEKGVRDVHFIMSEKEPSDLSSEEKLFLIEKFFSLNEETMLSRFDRFKELLELKRRFLGDNDKLLDAFGSSELFDLIVLFNLAWVNPLHEDEFPRLRELRKKGRGFSREDRDDLLKIHLRIMERVIPSYRKLFEIGVIDITASPYFHPILPLLIDSTSASDSTGGETTPSFVMSFPEDAKWHVLEGKNLLKGVFGAEPAGIWPSEGSVSRETLELLDDCNIEFTFTDEIVLSKSTSLKFVRDESGTPTNCEKLYMPWKFGRSNVYVFFRDHFLSDLIGFAYKSWNPEKAASHFVGLLEGICHSLEKTYGSARNFIVPIIFDGENPWEYYDNYGIAFLDALFKNLRDSSKLKVVSFREYLHGNSEIKPRTSGKIEPGSWIDGTFRIWFGHEEDLKAWEEVVRLRKLLFEERLNESVSAVARRYLYIAEGSDWYWWYGDDHFTAELDEFDSLFRKNLLKAYAVTGTYPPDTLKKPIYLPKRVEQSADGIFLLKPRGFVTAKIDGKITDFYEWSNAASFRHEMVFGAMHGGGVKIIERIFAGFDREFIFLRVDFTDSAFLSGEKFDLSVYFVGGKLDLKLDLSERSFNIISLSLDDSTVSFEDVLEISIPIKKIIPSLRELPESFAFEFSIGVLTSRLSEEKCPGKGKFVMRVTREDPGVFEWMA